MICDCWWVTTNILFTLMDRNFSLFFIPIYEGICSVLYHIVYTHKYESLYLVILVFRFVIHSEIQYIHAFIISDLPAICTCHNNLRLTYRIVKDFSSKIFFAIIYTAFSAVNQWFNHLVFFPLFHFLLHVQCT